MATGWKIETSAIKTDHKLVLVRVAHPESSKIGRCWWQQEENLLKDKELIGKIIKKGRELENRMNKLSTRTDENNIQTFFKEWKEEVIAMSRNRDKVLVPKMEV